MFSYLDTEKARLALENIASGNRLIVSAYKYDDIYRQHSSSLQNFHELNRFNGHWDNVYSTRELYDLSQEYMSKNPGKKIRSYN